MAAESNRTPRPLRLWPGVLAAVLLLLVRFGVPVVLPEQAFIGVIGGFVGALAIVIWWVLFSRAPWLERLAAIALMVIGLPATWRFAHVSISTGAMGGLLLILAVPPMTVALVAWAAASRGLARAFRLATMAATILLACGSWTLVKTGGFTTGFDNDLMWRWTPTHEDLLVADSSSALPSSPGDSGTMRESPPPLVPSTAPAPVAPASANSVISAEGEGVEALAPAVANPARVEWPGFRGPRRDGVIAGIRIETDWAASPPVLLWRRPIGPGWSSFAVHGGRLFTQEQRGDDEMVVSYDVATGSPVWSHRDAARFWESNGGAGPRATPTFTGGRLYTFGATGILNYLDARTGALFWTRDVAADTKTEIPMWGFASSPLVVDDLVIIAASGTLAAYDAATGKPRWVGPDHSVASGGSYSSPQRLTIDGVDQIVMVSEDGATGVAPADGTLLWEHQLRGSPVLQPMLTGEGDLLIHQLGLDGVLGIRRLGVRHRTGSWSTQEQWTTSALKTMSSDFVVHKGHAFGFDGSILTCVDLADGTRTWKGGRYGSGQLVLLADQDLLLVLTEEGEVALVPAALDRFTEIAKVPALEGKTWNHPVLAGDILLVRNGQEMAAFRLKLQRR
jgi:outer membrane protein assembly factor BamB